MALVFNFNRLLSISDKPGGKSPDEHHYPEEIADELGTISQGVLSPGER